MNAADAFDIGSFDEEDTKGIKVKRALTSKRYIYYPLTVQKMTDRDDGKMAVYGEFVCRACPLCTPHVDGHLLVGASSHDTLNSSERRQQVVVLTLIQTL